MLGAAKSRIRGAGVGAVLVTALALSACGASECALIQVFGGNDPSCRQDTNEQTAMVRWSIPSERLWNAVAPVMPAGGSPQLTRPPHQPTP